MRYQSIGKSRLWHVCDSNWWQKSQVLVILLGLLPTFKVNEIAKLQLGLIKIEMYFSLSSSWTPAFYPQVPWKSINCRLRATGLGSESRSSHLKEWSLGHLYQNHLGVLLENSRAPSKIYSVGRTRKLYFEINSPRIVFTQRVGLPASGLHWLALSFQLAAWMMKGRPPWRCGGEGGRWNAEAVPDCFEVVQVNLVGTGGWGIWEHHGRKPEWNILVKHPNMLAEAPEKL